MSKGTILAVDDATESLKLLMQILGRADYTVRPANSGELALASAAASPPDLILLDIRMQGMDGFSVCRSLKIKQETRNVPVIFLSATTDIDERIEGLRLGAVDFVSKPFRAEELLARVQTHLQVARLRKDLEKVASDRSMEADLASEALDVPLKEAAEARDWALVARLFEPTGMLLLMRSPALSQWLITLPADAYAAEPRLGFWRAYVLSGFGNLAEAERAALDVERNLAGADSFPEGVCASERSVLESGGHIARWDSGTPLDPPPSGGRRESSEPLSPNPSPLQGKRGRGEQESGDLARIRSLRGKIAELRGDGSAAVRLAQEGIALAATPRPNVPNSGVGRHWLGTAYCGAGLPVAAEELFRELCTYCQTFEGIRRWFTPIVYSWYGRSLYLQGHLNDAMAVCRQAMSLERQYGGPSIMFIYALETDILTSRNLLDIAQLSLEKAVDVGGRLDQWFTVPGVWLSAARLLYARGKVADADVITENLTQWSRANDAGVILDRAEAIRANHWLMNGQLERAWLWAQQRQHTDDVDVTYANEAKLLTLARLFTLRARATGDQSLLKRAVRLLQKIRQSAASDGRMGDHLTALTAEAVATDLTAEPQRALEVLEECLTAAIPESAFRVFLDEGGPMLDLLRRSSQSGLLPETTRGLIAMFEASAPPSSPEPRKCESKDSVLINPLTDREHELLSLIASGMSNSDLAKSLFISNNTVKTHVKHLFQKLNASARTEAVARARFLGLLN